MERHRRNWEELAAVDPLWAVLSVRGLRGRWQLDGFLATGDADVAALLEICAEVARPKRRERVLDFGCGVGRLARPFAREFAEYVGVDVAEGMVNHARELHADLQNCTFVLGGDLGAFADASFDLVFANLVLQHLPSRPAVERSVLELLRVVRRDGLLVFQLPSRLAPTRRLQPRRRVYALLRRLGLTPPFLQRRLGLHPIRVLAIPEADVRALLERRGATVERVLAEEVAGVSSRRYYVTAAPR